MQSDEDITRVACSAILRNSLLKGTFLDQDDQDLGAPGIVTQAWQWATLVAASL